MADVDSKKVAAALAGTDLAGGVVKVVSDHQVAITGPDAAPAGAVVFLNPAVGKGNTNEGAQILSVKTPFAGADGKAAPIGNIAGVQRDYVYPGKDNPGGEVEEKSSVYTVDGKKLDAKTISAGQQYAGELSFVTDPTETSSRHVPAGNTAERADAAKVAALTGGLTSGQDGPGVKAEKERIQRWGAAAALQQQEQERCAKSESTISSTTYLPATAAVPAASSPTGKDIPAQGERVAVAVTTVPGKGCPAPANPVKVTTFRVNPQ